MRSYKKESARLKKSQNLVTRLKTNKKQEITRLLYEISKRENIEPESILSPSPQPSPLQGEGAKNKSPLPAGERVRVRGDFAEIKKTLLKRRFPRAYPSNVHLPKIKLDSNSAQDTRELKFYPKRIFVEKSANSSTLAQRFKKSFPKARSIEIKSLKDHLKENRGLTISDYNKRKDAIFITYENYDFFKKCPCTKKAIGCGYHIFNLSFGCLFDCTYCYLQEYTNSPGLIFPANIDKFFKNFFLYKRPGMRIGTGEFSDSLMLDHITEYSLPIIEFFKKHKDVRFEFKTKSINIDHLLKAKHAGNIVVAWSLNPQRIIDENEFFTPSLTERLNAAKKCVAAGYKASCHFDPVVYFKGWEKEYKKVIDMLFDTIKPKDIAWISIGTLRFNPKVKQTIEARFPGNKILNEELVLDFDNKLRYPDSIRQEIYDSMLKMLYKHSKKLPIYLCMENSSIWRELKLRPTGLFR